MPGPSLIVVDPSYSKKNHVRHESDVSFSIAFGKLLLMEMMKRKSHPPGNDHIWMFPKIVLPPNHPF